MRILDENKSWVPNMICGTCITMMNRFEKTKNKHLNLMFLYGKIPIQKQTVTFAIQMFMVLRLKTNQKYNM